MPGNPAVVRPMTDRVSRLFALVIGTVVVAVVAPAMGPESIRTAWFGFAAGGLIVLLFWHRYRALGFVPLLMTIFFGLVVYGAVTGEWVGWLIGAVLGAAWVALAAHVPIRGAGVRWLAVGAIILLSVSSLLSFAAPDEWASWFVAGVTITIVVAAWVVFFRPAFELTCEPLLWIMYRIRAAGPGLAQVPARGPVLVVANHACWFDPLFLAKVLPRPVTPMMTSRFYDLPVMSWLMRWVFHTIRVPEKPSKEEMPAAVREAIAALDRGECVVIFPEGFLRRTEEKPLRRFGRGVWQILSARPDTPVFCCWIEGGWGSYASYFNGRPTKNKRPDFRRPIGVGVSAPVAVDPATLANHLHTRVYLMNRVAEARKLLGLPELPPFELPAQEGREDEEE